MARVPASASAGSAPLPAGARSGEPAPPTRPPLRYHGSKWRLAPWIIRHFPAHKVYVEAFGGGAAVLLQKPRSRVEVYNDLDDDVVNFFRVLRDPDDYMDLCERIWRTAYARQEYELAHQPTRESVERARRLIVRAHMGFGSNAGTRRSACGFRAADWSSRQANNLAWPAMPAVVAAAHDRFLGGVIENRDALEVVEAQDSPRTLFYLDPPYVHATRVAFAKDRSYRHEMTDEDHRQLAELAHRVEGFVLVSGYHSRLYDELYADWPRVEREALTQGNANTQRRREVLWLSPQTAMALREGLLGLDLGALGAHA